MRAKMSVKDIVMPREPIGELGIRGEMCRVSPQSVPFVIGPPTLPPASLSASDQHRWLAAGNVVDQYIMRMEFASVWIVELD